MVNAVDIQRLIVLEVGDTDDYRLTTWAGKIWQRYADKAQLAPRLQECYAKRALIDIAIGYCREQVNFSVGGDFTYAAGDKVKTLEAMRVETQAEINQIEALAASGRIPAMAAMSATTPLAPRPNAPNALDQRYTGSPYVRPSRPL